MSLGRSNPAGLPTSFCSMRTLWSISPIHAKSLRWSLTVAICRKKISRSFKLSSNNSQPLDRASTGATFARATLLAQQTHRVVEQGVYDVHLVQQEISTEA